MINDRRSQSRKVHAILATVQLSWFLRSSVMIGLLIGLGCEGGQKEHDKSITNQASSAKLPGDRKGHDEGREKDTSIRLAIPELREISWEAAREYNLPLNNPPIVRPAEAYFLKPEDIVLGVLLGESARAYPWFMLANYHAVNDFIDRKPIIVTLCETCNGGAAFLANTGDTTLDFRPRGLKHETWYAIDFQTGSHWYPFRGTAFEGPLQGTKLERIRSYFSTWRNWVGDHPHTTVVLSSDEVRLRPHGRNTRMAAKSTLRAQYLKRIATPGPNPKRKLLPGHELVFGLIPKGDAPAKAYTLEHLEQAALPIQTRIDGVPVLILQQNQYQVGAYVRKLNKIELQLQVQSRDPLLMSDQLGNT